jgi:diguanylate cyclase (GGDEF)-like protein
LLRRIEKGSRLTVARKTTLTTLAVVFVCLTIAGVLMLRGIRQAAAQECRDEAILLGRTLAGSFALPLARGEHEAIQGQIDQMAEAPELFQQVLLVVVIDERGRILAHSDPSRFGELWTGTRPSGEEVSVDPSGLAPRVTLRMPIATAVRFGSLELVMSVEGPWQVAQRATFTAVALLIAMLVLLVTVLSVMLRRLLVRPLERLSQAAHHFQAGQRQLGVVPEGPGEFLTLVQAFDGMAQRIYDHTEELERTVQDRTQELSRSNEQLQLVNQHLQVLNQQLEELAVTDGLTGVANRRAFNDRLDLEVERAKRSSQPLSLVMIDLDRFKRLNDTLGHLEGDAALVQLGALLGEKRRAVDLVARYGGEEFMVLLPGTTHEDAMLVAERIRHATEVAPLPGQCTVSAGVATLPVHATDSRSLISAADQALYAAKDHGRNRVVSADGLGSMPAAIGASS